LPPATGLTATLGIMEILWFLKQRTAFVRQLYNTSSEPYNLRKKLIESQSAPYIPRSSDKHEPDFISEWTEADDSLHVLACSCISIISVTLNSYFKAWEIKSTIKLPKDKKFTNGWLHGYLDHFSTTIGIDTSECPANLSLLEEIILVRNRVQHEELITQIRPNFFKSDLNKIATPVFVTDWERNLAANEKKDEVGLFWIPTIDISSEKLMQAITEVEIFAEWFDQQMCCHLYLRKN
jgi:hypothetical protein